MKSQILPLLLLSAAPLFAGEPAPMMTPAPAPVAGCDCLQGFTFGLEALVLRPYADVSDNEVDDFEFGFRGSLGYEFGDCLFAKLTGFGYSSDIIEGNGSPGFNFAFDEQGEVDVAYVDLVIGQHFCPDDKLKLSPFVGLRWASVSADYRYREFGVLDGVQTFGEKYSSDFDGLGIVIGIDATRSLGNSFSIYGTAKQSIVFGEGEFLSYGWNDEDGYFRTGSDDSDDVIFVTELGLGVQYDFAFSNVAANVRAGVEAQWWTGTSGVSQGSGDDLGLAGFVFGANFVF